MAGKHTGLRVPMDPEALPSEREPGHDLTSMAEKHTSVCVPMDPEADTPVFSETNGEPLSPIFPEGGFRAWATVAGAFLIQFCGFGYTTSFGVYQDFYTRDYLSQSLPSTISWIGSINSFIVNAGGLVSGRLYDRGHFYLLLYGGSLLQCFSLFILSLCKPQKLYQVLLVQGIGLGLGAGIVCVPSLAVVSHYFFKRRALAMVIVASGAPLGAVVHPIMLNNTLHSSLGFPGAVRVSAGLITGTLLIACSMMHPRLPPPSSYLPFLKSLGHLARDKAYIFSTLGMTTFAVGYYFPLVYLQLDAVVHGIDETFAFYSLVIMNAANFIGRLLPGLVVERFGILNMFVTAAACGAVLILCMIALGSVASVVVLGIMYGFCTGIYITLIPPLVAMLTNDISELGLRIGITYAIVGIGGLIGPPVSGALLTGRYVWWRPALFSGLIALVGLAFFIATLVTVRRKAALNVPHAPTPNSEKEKKPGTSNRV
ncbi:MFS general substrate transporter [Mycena sanguinolenta]|uniref:MFS general substrate transporter n=1 Tax=Mycena sanguinolenta TaxID=230812 RepID=A0A8H6XLC9_9AGAR|nr:MFS general substrate transporter [Mycena sanguinolenta]